MKLVLVSFFTLTLNLMALNLVRVGGGGVANSNSGPDGFVIVKRHHKVYHNCIKHGKVNTVTAKLMAADGHFFTKAGCEQCLRAIHDKNVAHKRARDEKESSSMESGGLKKQPGHSKKIIEIDLMSVPWKGLSEYLPIYTERKFLYDQTVSLLFKFSCVDKELKSQIVTYGTYITEHKNNFGVYVGETTVKEKYQKLVWEERDVDCDFYPVLLNFVKNYEKGNYNGKLKLNEALNSLKNDFDKIDGICNRCSAVYDGLLYCVGPFEPFLSSNESTAYLVQNTYSVDIDAKNSLGTTFTMKHAGRVEVLEVVGGWCPDTDTSMRVWSGVKLVNPVDAFNGTRYAPGNGTTSWLVIIPEDKRNDVLLETGLFKQYAVLPSLVSKKSGLSHMDDVHSEFRGVRVLLPKNDRTMERQKNYPDTIGVDFWFPAGNHHIRINDCNDCSNNSGKVSVRIKVSYVTINGE